MRKYRDKNESNLLSIASKTQIESAHWMMSNLKIVTTEDDKIKKET